MNYGLALVTGPAIEPVTLAEAKAHLRVDDDITAEDALIVALIRTARQQVETATGRALLTQTWDLALPGYPAGGCIELPLPPLQSVTSVTSYDTAGAATVWPAANYYVDTYGWVGRVVLGYGLSWPTTTLRPANGVMVRYVAGYGAGAGDVPEPIRAALLLWVGHLYEDRQAVTGQIATGNMQIMPMGVQSLLAPYWAKRF